MKKGQKKIGELLIEAGLIDEYQLASAIGEQRTGKGKLASILIRRGFVREEAVTSVLENQLGMKCVPLEGIKVAREALNKIAADIAEKYCVLPIDFDQQVLTLAMPDPTDLKSIDDLTFTLGLKIKPVLSLESSIKRAQARHYKEIFYEDDRLTADIETQSEYLDTARREQIRSPFELPTKPEIILDALSEILIEKGIITRSELTSRIRRKLKLD
jgi:type IV pilus assembly protein PilB